MTSDLTIQLLQEWSDALRTQYQICGEAIIPRQSPDAPTVEQLSRIRAAHLSIMPLVEQLQATMQENDNLKHGNSRLIIANSKLGAENDNLKRKLATALQGIQTQSDWIKEMRKALKAVDAAYCGVGDFEGTGENMAAVIVQVRKALRYEVTETDG